jgi:hypothetical protein
LRFVWQRQELRRQLQFEAGVGVPQIESGQVGGALQPVAQRVGMDVQRGCRLVPPEAMTSEA